MFVILRLFCSVFGSETLWNTVSFLFISFPFHSAFPGLLSFVCERMTSFGSQMMWTPTCRVLSLSYLKGGIYVIWVGMAKVYFTWHWEKSQLQSQSKWKTCILAFNQGVCLRVLRVVSIFYVVTCTVHAVSFYCPLQGDKFMSMCIEIYMYVCIFSQVHCFIWLYQSMSMIQCFFSGSRREDTREKRSQNRCTTLCI